MNTWCSTRVVPIFCPGPLPYSRNTRNMPFFIVRVIEHFLQENVTSPQIQHKLLGLFKHFWDFFFYKYTTQHMTVECQLKLSRNNSHERTWGHHLQYNRFHTTLIKHWRELTVNSSTDHVTNTCSDDSLSCDFIVVWELRRPLRVLPTFEDGDLTFSWKKVIFQAITVTRKQEVSWKFLCHFQIQRPQISKV